MDKVLDLRKKQNFTDISQLANVTFNNLKVTFIYVY